MSCDVALILGIDAISNSTVPPSKLDSSAFHLYTQNLYLKKLGWFDQRNATGKTEKYQQTSNPTKGFFFMFFWCHKMISLPETKRSRTWKIDGLEDFLLS